MYSREQSLQIILLNERGLNSVRPLRGSRISCSTLRSGQL
jgi:phage baseplate assembly protein W